MVEKSPFLANPSVLATLSEVGDAPAPLGGTIGEVK